MESYRELRERQQKEFNELPLGFAFSMEQFRGMMEEWGLDPEKYVEEKGLKTVSDDGALREVIEKIVADNPKSVEDYNSGKKKAIGFLVGQTMKAMQGKADPGMVNKILKEVLG